MSNHGGFPLTALMKANSPQKKMSTQMETAIFFSRDQTECFAEKRKHQIKQNVVPLPHCVNAGRSSLLHQLGEPGVVNVTAEIARFDVGVPEARNRERKRNEQVE